MNPTGIDILLAEAATAKRPRIVELYANAIRYCAAFEPKKLGFSDDWRPANEAIAKRFSLERVKKDAWKLL